MFVHCCHCRDCQRQTGTAFALNALIETGQMEIFSGEPSRSRCRRTAASPHRIYRCPDCRIAVWSEYGGRSALALSGSARSTIPRIAPGRAHLHPLEAALGEPARGFPAFEAYYDARQLWPAGQAWNAGAPLSADGAAAALRAAALAQRYLEAALHARAGHHGLVPALDVGEVSERPDDARAATPSRGSRNRRSKSRPPRIGLAETLVEHAIEPRVSSE